MKFRFVWVGKTRNPNYLALQRDYAGRLSHFVKCEFIEVRDAQDKEIEGNRIVEKLNPSTLVCLLDVEGKSVSSHDLAKQIEAWQNAGTREITFVIGGADGVSSTVAEKADVKVSLSFLTLTHEMARVVLVEQLYRAFTIIKGFPYQK
ncbi:MAG TPA: 23S rRNA (pseudouridine(1915)-N(3))-methyltransferase RlmH [Pyrinomonadaceae bacterium]|jgi:23S rRNA (pseudouridine1915-N3)-methyltransferase|nr:23S rRNA (pseudouridine(1915)-N(3))-methyltransferase RlmH [Pyrinomonadaceae bacterium]